jgi:hypothetical protein
MSLSISKAQEIAAKHSSSELVFSEITELNDRVSRFRIHQCSMPTGVRALIISSQENGAASQANKSVESISRTLNLISTHTDIGFPRHAVDTSRSIIPYDYIYVHPIDVPAASPKNEYDHISLHDAIHTKKLEARQSAAIQLHLGSFIAQLHAIQNDFFGFPPPADTSALTESSLSPAFTAKPTLPFILPADPEPPNSYSWQETFVHLLDDLISELQTEASSDIAQDVAFQDIQTYLSRAIAFFLFDDVEVPSLISVSLSTKDIILRVSREDAEHQSDPEIHHILPTFAGSLVYGDPLLESLFSHNMSNVDEEGTLLGESEPFLEGYGNRLIMFKRQRTKRLWYDLYLALMVLAQQTKSELRSRAEIRERKQALTEVKRCVTALRDAPCY